MSLLCAAWGRDLNNQCTSCHRTGYLFLVLFNVSFTFTVHLLCFFSVFVLLFPCIYYFRSNSRKCSHAGSEEGGRGRGVGVGGDFCLFLAKVISNLTWVTPEKEAMLTLINRSDGNMSCTNNEQKIKQNQQFLKDLMNFTDHHPIMLPITFWVSTQVNSKPIKYQLSVNDPGRNSRELFFNRFSYFHTHSGNVMHNSMSWYKHHVHTVIKLGFYFVNYGTLKIEHKLSK